MRITGPTLFKHNDWVRLKHSVSKRTGWVAAIVGPLGGNGMMVYGLFLGRTENSTYIEVREDQMELISPVPLELTGYKVGERVRILHSAGVAGWVDAVVGPVEPYGVFVYSVRLGRSPESTCVEVREDKLERYPEPADAAVDVPQAGEADLVQAAGA